MENREDFEFELDTNELMWDYFLGNCSRNKLRNVSLRLTEPGDGYHPDDVSIHESPAKGSRRFREIYFLFGQLVDLLIDDTGYKMEDHWRYYNVLSSIIFREERIKFSNVVPLIVRKNQPTKHQAAYALRQQRKEDILLGYTLKSGKKTLPAKANERGRRWASNLLRSLAYTRLREKRRVCLDAAKQIEFTREITLEYQRIKADVMPSEGELKVWDLVQDKDRVFEARMMIRRGIKAAFFFRVANLVPYKVSVIKAPAGLPLTGNFMGEKEYLAVAEEEEKELANEMAFGAVSCDQADNYSCVEAPECNDATSALSCDTYMANLDACFEELCPPEPKMTAMQLKRYTKKWDKMWERRQSNLVKIKKRLAKEEAKAQARQAKPALALAKKRVSAEKKN